MQGPRPRSHVYGESSSHLKYRRYMAVYPCAVELLMSKTSNTMSNSPYHLENVKRGCSGMQAGVQVEVQCLIGSTIGGPIGME